MGAARRWSAGWGLAALCALALACSPDDGDKEDADSGAQDAGAQTDGDAAVAEVLGGDGAGQDAGDAGAVGLDTGPKSEVLTARALKFGENMNGVWGSGPTDIWWVGDKGRILHDNGAVLAPRDSGTKANLHAVWGVAPDNVWFVGDGVTLQYNGVAIVDRTPEANKKTVFYAAHGSKDGQTLLFGGSGGAVLRYVPSKNTLMAEETGSQLEIHGMYAESAGIVWAMGTSGQALKLSGGSWSSTTMPKAGNRVVRDIDGVGSRMYAVGEEGYVAATDPIDKTWAAGVSNDPQSRDLRGIWAVDDKEAWAVGVKGALIHFMGTKWNFTDIDGTYMKTRTFNAIWGKAGDPAVGYAVGEAGAGLRFEGGKWLDYKAETTAHLLSVAALDDGRVAAVGHSGLLLVAPSATEDFVSLGVAVTGADLHDVASDGVGGLWAVGKAGVVVRVAKDGTASVSVPPAAAGKDLQGVAALGGGKAIAVGQGGTALIYDGSGWQAESTGVQWNWRSVATTGGKAWVVGEKGAIAMRDAAGKWTSETSGVLIDLNRVVAWGDGEAVAVGDNGLVLARGGGGWQAAFEEAALFLYGVTRRDDGLVIAVGWGGTLVVGQGAKFKKIESGLFNVLRDVVATKAGTVAVGYKGGIYQVAGKLVP